MGDRAASTRDQAARRAVRRAGGPWIREVMMEGEKEVRERAVVMRVI